MNIPLAISNLKAKSLGNSPSERSYNGTAKFKLDDYSKDFLTNANDAAFINNSENDFITKAFNTHQSAKNPSELMASLDSMNMDLVSLSIGDMEPQVDSLGFSIMDLNKFTFMGGNLAEGETDLLGIIRQQLFQAQSVLESTIRKTLADPNISSVDKQKLESYLTNIKSAREWQPQAVAGKAQIDFSAWANDKNSLNTTGGKTLSEQGIQALKGVEGFSARSYSDYSQHTNGYGTKAKYAGETIDPQTAELRLKDDLKHREAFINRVAEARLEKTGKGLSQAQFDSLTMMVFNLGLGQAHEVHQAVIDGKDELVPKLMNKYVHAGGKVLPGLISRRQQEAGLYNYGAEQLSEAEMATS